MEIEDIEIIENNYPLYKKSICEFMDTLKIKILNNQLKSQFKQTQ